MIKKIIEVICEFAHIAPDLKEGKINNIWENKKSLSGLISSNLFFKTKKNINGIKREKIQKKSLVDSLFCTKISTK